MSQIRTSRRIRTLALPLKADATIHYVLRQFRRRMRLAFHSPLSMNPGPAPYKTSTTDQICRDSGSLLFVPRCGTDNVTFFGIEIHVQSGVEILPLRISDHC